MSGGQTDVDMMMRQNCSRHHRVSLQGHRGGKSTFVAGTRTEPTGAGLGKGEESGGARTLLSDMHSTSCIPHLQEKSPWTQGKAGGLSYWNVSSPRSVLITRYSTIGHNTLRA